MYLEERVEHLEKQIEELKDQKKMNSIYHRHNLPKR